MGSCDPECVRSRRQPGQSRPTDPGEETRRTGSSLWSAREGQPGGESVEGPLGVGRDRVTWQRDPRGVRSGKPGEKDRGEAGRGGGGGLSLWEGFLQSH